MWVSMTFFSSLTHMRVPSKDPIIITPKKNRKYIIFVYGNIVDQKPHRHYKRCRYASHQGSTSSQWWSYCPSCWPSPRTNVPRSWSKRLSCRSSQLSSVYWTCRSMLWRRSRPCDPQETRSWVERFGWMSRRRLWHLWQLVWCLFLINGRFIKNQFLFFDKTSCDYKPSVISSLITLTSPLSQPAATKPWERFHEHAVIVVLFGTFILIEELCTSLQITVE